MASAPALAHGVALRLAGRLAACPPSRSDARASPAPLLFCGLLLPACQPLHQFPDPARALAGTWDNQAQYEAADPELHRPPAAGTPYEWLDRQHATFRIVEAPALAGAGGTAVHLLWRSGGPDGPISRQRLWVFRPNPHSGRLEMHFHAFLDPEPFADATPDSAAFRTLTIREVTTYPDRCVLPVRRTRHGFRAQIPQFCEISARSGRTMTLSADIRLTRFALTYAEQGLLPDGSVAFRVPNPGPYVFTRLPPAGPSPEAPLDAAASARP